MTNLRRPLIFSMTLFLACAVDSTHVRASSIGFHNFLKHHEGETFGLPRLYEPIPKHVPELTNQQVIRVWETNQYSPILRDAGIEKQLCEAVTERRDLNPTRFDHYHPTLGRLLSDPKFFQYALYLYNLDTRRFVHYHHHLIPIIRGCALMMMENHGTSPAVISNPPPTPQQLILVPPQGLSIPAPPSLVLMALGVGGCLAVRFCLDRALCGR
jgi:hypothetical protein